MKLTAKSLATFGAIAVLVTIFLWRNSRNAGEVSRIPNSRAADQIEQVESTRNQLLSATDAVSGKSALAELAKALRKSSNEDASAHLRTFLDSGRDALTHLGFKLRTDGSLEEAPTLRTFALDQLIQFDPAAAAEIAKRVLANKTSADEWAVALRACGLVNSNEPGRAFLQSKARELVQYDPWRTNASAGFLESFDIFVFTHDTNFVPQLSRFISDRGNPAVAHAAFLTLDRLVQSDAAPTLRALVDQRELLAGREEARSGFFARADLRDTAQRELLAQYLLSPTRSTTELAVFAEVFPNANFMVSANLLTHSTTLSGDDLRQRDAAALETVNSWLTDERFTRLQSRLRQIQSRLIQFGAGSAR